MFRTGRSRQNNFILVAVGLVVVMLGLMSVYYMFESLGPELQGKFVDLPEGSQVTYKKPLPGHWLKTEPDEEETGKLSEGKNLEGSYTSHSEGRTEGQILREEDLGDSELPFVRTETSYRHLNRELDSTNVLYIWTDKGQLKVVSVMTLNKTNKRPAVVVVPIATAITDKGDTLQDIFSREGKDGIHERLESLLEAKLHNYVQIDNEALYALSDILGTLNLQNEKVTMAQALEESAAGIRTNDETIVREVAKKAVQPSTWMKLPKLVRVFQENIKSDFSIGEMIGLLNFTRQLQIESTEKAVLGGTSVYEGGKLRKVVHPDSWQNCLYDATNR